MTTTRRSCWPTASMPWPVCSPRKDRGRLEELRRNGPPEGKSAVDVFNDIRVMRSRDRYDLAGLTDDQILRNGTIHLFPNLIGPLVHGNATLYRGATQWARP